MIWKGRELQTRSYRSFTLTWKAKNLLAQTELQHPRVLQSLSTTTSLGHFKPLKLNSTVLLLLFNGSNVIQSRFNSPVSSDGACWRGNIPSTNFNTFSQEAEIEELQKIQDALELEKAASAYALQKLKFELEGEKIANRELQKMKYGEWMLNW